MGDWYVVELQVTQKLNTALRKGKILYDRESITEPRALQGFSFPYEHLDQVRKLLRVPKTSRNVLTRTSMGGIYLLEFEDFDMSQVEARFRDDDTTARRAEATPEGEVAERPVQALISPFPPPLPVS